MKLSRYPAYKDNENSFWFISNGKAGNIAKAVFFQELPEENRFNLAMGDYQKVTDEINFKELTNNGDARKVFVTIAHIVEYYTSKHPEREIFLAGNTNDKKRAYSIMGVWIFRRNYS